MQCASRRSKLSDAFCTIDHDHLGVVQLNRTVFLPWKQKTERLSHRPIHPDWDLINVDCETRIRRTGIPTRRSDFLVILFFYNYRNDERGQVALVDTGPDVSPCCCPACLLNC